MSEFQTEGTIIELHSMDDDEILSGYWSGYKGEPEPGSDKSNSFYHGWCNGMVDSKRMEPTQRQMLLAREIVETGYLVIAKH